MLFKILAGLAAVVGIFLLYVFFLPSHYEISRNVAIQASASEIFPLINNPRKMDQWNPWIELDPKAKVSYSGPDQGMGAKSSWESPGQLGTGSATITESIENQSVETRLEFVKPFEGFQMSELSIRPSGDHTIVTWTVRGQNNFIGRVFCFFMNMEKMIGATFEKGLLNLKTLVEDNK